MSEVAPPPPLFRCGLCGGDVRNAAGAGRTLDVGGTVLPLPDDLLVPTCGRCGETYWSPELHAQAIALGRKG